MLNINRRIYPPRVSFSPGFFKNAVKQYRAGYVRDLIGLMEEAEIDSHTSGCLIGRMAGFSSAWRITEFSGGKEDLEVCDFVRSVLGNLDMNKLFRDIFDALLKKFSVVELNWEVKKGRHLVSSAEKINQRYFRIIDENRVVIDWLNETKEIPEEAALVLYSDKNPVLLSVLRDYILKEFGLKSWVSFIETFGEAFIIGKYPPGADRNFRDEVEKGVLALGNSSRGIAPQGTDLEIIESKRNSGDHEKLVKTCDRGISVAILGHANAVENSSGLQVGQNMAAYQVKREIAISDICFIEAGINRLIRMLVDRNFTVKGYPGFSIDKSKPVNITEHLQIIKQAYEQGYKIHPDEYNKLGLYKYDDQAALVKKED